MFYFFDKMENMSLHSRYVIKNLLSSWPYGAVRMCSVLESQGLYRQLAYKYAKSGWLVHYGHGAYARLGDPVHWLGAVYGLQESGLAVHVGGRTALELQGASHFIRMAEKPLVHLYTQASQHLPSWVLKHEWQAQFILVKVKLSAEELGLVDYPFQGFSVKASCPERAMLELLPEVSDETSFEEASYLMEGLGSLRPALVQSLLESCQSIKAKRLFLFLARYHGHLWVKDLNPEKVYLGVGCRSVVKGGQFDAQHLITVPQTFSKLNIEDVP